ncbi:MAG: DUF2207 domain-containing protein, partial [Actinomycetes bacterium]
MLKITSDGPKRRFFTLSNRFSRILLLFLLLLAAAGALFWPLVITSAGARTDPDPVNLRQYVGDFNVAADGTMAATETLVAEFPAGRHGIYRFFDTSDPNDPNLRRVPQITSVTRDGVGDPVEISWQAYDTIMVAKIGDPDAVVSPGKHTYVIAYTVPGVISPVSAGANKSFPSAAGENASTPPQSTFYWNVIAQNWVWFIPEATIHVTLPSASQQVQCAAGKEYRTGEQYRTASSVSGPCTIVGAGTKSITLTASAIPLKTGMTVRANMAPPPPEQQPGLVTLPWPVRWCPVLGRSLPIAAVVLLATLIAFFGGLYWSLRGRERKPGFPVMYEPPPGLGPAQTVYMTREHVGKNALSATLFDMAQKKLVTLQSSGHKTRWVNTRAWTITSTATPEQWAGADPAIRAVGDALWLSNGVGRTFLAERNVSAGSQLKSASDNIEPAVLEWAKSSGYVRRLGAEVWGKRLWMLASTVVVLGFVAGIFASGWPTMFGLPFAAFAIAGFGLANPDVGTRRTAAGRELWSRCGGFKRMLSSNSSQDRFDFAANFELFLSFIPYAVAFEVADKWVQKYRMYTNAEPPIPVWCPSGEGDAGWYASGGGFSDFSNTISS